MHAFPQPGATNGPQTHGFPLRVAKASAVAARPAQVIGTLCGTGSFDAGASARICSPAGVSLANALNEPFTLHVLALAAANLSGPLADFPSTIPSFASSPAVTVTKTNHTGKRPSVLASSHHPPLHPRSYHLPTMPTFIEDRDDPLSPAFEWCGFVNPMEYNRQPSMAAFLMESFFFVCRLSAYVQAAP